MGEDQIHQLKEEVDQLNRRLQLQEQKIEELQRLLMGSNYRRQNSQQTSIPPKKSSWSMENFIGLRLIHFIGIIVLVIGLSIGVKYAIDRNLISESLRIILAYAAGLILYFLSRYLKKNYPFFSTILFSGAMASLYFTTYGAHVYYSIFSFATAFIIMIIMTAYTVYEAISYDRQEIALLGLVGAYGIPFLISKNEERADLFFLYISLINAAVIYLSVKKGWKNVGRAAQLITWILFLGWASVRYQAELQSMGLLLLSFFFLLFAFLVGSVKIVHRNTFTINDTYQLVLNSIGLYIGALFIFGDSFESRNVSIVTLFVSCLSAVQAFALWYYWKEEIFTRRVFASLSLMLFVIFVGLNWNGFIVTLLWLLTAVIVFISGVRIKSVTARMAAILLIGVTLIKLIAFDSLRFSTVEKVIAYLILGVLLLLVSFFYQKFKQKIFDEKE